MWILVLKLLDRVTVQNSLDGGGESCHSIGDLSRVDGFVRVSSVHAAASLMCGNALWPMH